MLQLDAALFKLINQTLSAEWMDGWMIFCSSQFGWLPLYGLLIYLLFRHQSWKPGAVSVLLLVAAFGISDSFTSRVVKPYFQRQRPYMVESNLARLPEISAEEKSRFIQDNRTNYGFVSSHASNFFAVMLLSSLLLNLKGYRKFILLLIASLVAYSRVYLGKHYPLDVVCGGLLGCLIAIGLFVLYRRWILPKLIH
ncbi:MAG: phosphatase PAP2 family protein [Bacteroidetes bacterium]|nr:phosphatase PAP2 family protein [Bacteroidota bacterium]